MTLGKSGQFVLLTQTFFMCQVGDVALYQLSRWLLIVQKPSEKYLIFTSVLAVFMRVIFIVVLARLTIYPLSVQRIVIGLRMLAAIL